uniref:Uncharacterized protein n=1 Tax=Kalanchoe fedtschenkoi TaxID=63787 RepID=A0A7N0U5S7_KALFE
MAEIASASPELCTAVSLMGMRFGACMPKWRQKMGGLVVLIGPRRRNWMRVVSASMNEDFSPEVRKIKVGFS